MAGYSDGTFLLCCTVLCFAVVRRLCFFVRFFVHSTEVNSRVSTNVWCGYFFVISHFYRYCLPRWILISAIDIATSYSVFDLFVFIRIIQTTVYVCAVCVRVCLLCSHQSFAVLTAVTLGYIQSRYTVQSRISI